MRLVAWWWWWCLEKSRAGDLRMLQVSSLKSQVSSLKSQVSSLKSQVWRCQKSKSQVSVRPVTRMSVCLPLSVPKLASVSHPFVSFTATPNAKLSNWHLQYSSLRSRENMVVVRHLRTYFLSSVLVPYLQFHPSLDSL